MTKIYDAISPIVRFNSINGTDITKRDLTDPIVQIYRSLIKEEHLDELEPAFQNGDVTEVVDAANDLIVVATGLLIALGVDPNETMKIVNDSNLSKFCYNVQDAEASVKAYENDPRYYDVHYAQVGDAYIIRGKKSNDNSGGWKILKGVNFKEPDFSEVIAKRG